MDAQAEPAHPRDATAMGSWAAELDTARQRLAREAVAADDLMALCWRIEDDGDLRASAALSMAGAQVAEAAGRMELDIALRANAIRLLHSLGDLRQAADYGAQALPRLRRASPASKAKLLSTLALVHASMDRIDRAIELLRQAQAQALVDDPWTSRLVASRSGEILALFGRHAAAAAEYRRAYALIKDAPAADGLGFNHGYVRLVLATALLMAALVEDQPLPADELRQLMNEAGPHAERAQGLRLPYIALRGLAAAALGERSDAWIAAFLALPADLCEVEEGQSQAVVCAWATLEAVRHGRAVAAAALLARIDPAQSPLAWPSWAAAWHQARAEVHAVTGDLASALASWREFAAVDRRTRSRQVSLAFEMADLASQANEIRSRQRQADHRAERLARQNATLTSERARLVASATTDPLTGLGNRRALQAQVAALQALRRPVACTLVLGDVDHFKAVNDRFSHAVGDQVLAAVGAILAQSVRGQDRAVRWGGEEFLLLYRGTVSPPRIDHLRRAIEAHDWSALAPGLAVTMSFGVAPWPTDSAFESALALADQRLYAAKRGGRNRVVAD